MKIYKYIPLCVLCALLAGCIGGIDTGGGGGGDVGAPTLAVVPANGQTFSAWVPDPTNPGDSYELNRGGDQVFDGTATNFNETGLTNGERVCYTITAVTGTARATSAQACATPMADITLAITNQSLSALLNWTESLGASSYHIYVGDPVPSASLSKGTSKAVGDPPIVVAGPPYTLTGLSNCSDYPVKVVPVDIDGNESESEVSYIDAEPITQGYLNTSFGTDGVVVENAIVGAFYDVALFSDGRVAAVRNDALDSTLFIYNSDGSDNDEINLSAALPLGLGITRARTLVIDEDDNIYVAGRDDDLRICKLDSGGNIDTTFGQPANPGCYYRGGVLDSRAQDITIHPSGDLILTGDISDLAVFFAVWRFTSDGALVWEYTYGAGVEEYLGEAVTVQGDRIVAAGTDSSLAADRLIVVSLDFSGGDAIVVFDMGAGAAALGYGIAEAPDGSVVVTGRTADAGAQSYVGIWNYPTDLSSVDLYLYSLTTGAALGSFGFDIQYDCRDRIVVAGVDLDAAVRTVVLRTDDTFSIDTSFGNIDPTNGWFLYNVAANDFSQAIVQDELGRIYVVGLQDDGAFHPSIMRLQ